MATPVHFSAVGRTVFTVAVLTLAAAAQAQPLPKSDTLAPTLVIAPVYDGQTVSGTFYIQALAKDNDAIARVQLGVDGQDTQTLAAYPYYFFFDSRTFADGPHQLTFTATDRSGNSLRRSLTLVVDNASYAVLDPFVPDPVTGFRTAEVTSTRIRFQWNAAADNVAATRYMVFRNGTPVGTIVSPALEFADEGLAPNTSYSYQVQAFDAAGNASDLSSPLALTTRQQDGNILTAGPNGQYAKPCDAIRKAAAWDTVEIDAAGNGTYDGDVCQFKIDNLTIRGVNGRARVDAAGKASQSKGTWVVSGANNIIENMEMSGASVADQNGAAVRSEGINLTLRNVYFHHNEDGLLTGSGAGSTILIEYSEFAYNGFGDGQSHNMYIGAVDR
ncbi:MAG: Ig-like domain-containing protein, partial [Acidobacteria bacterium]|nr:Ig-like domain-containing protein [Acidobacteriota bacterium]